MQPDSPLLTKWKDRFGARRPHDLEISGPIVEIDDFERRRRHMDGTLVSHVLVIRKFGNIGITATQLNLRPGDVVEVLEKYPVGYWRGRHKGREGIFDAECCVPCKPDGEPLEGSALLLDPGELRDMMVEDAETSESHGGAGDAEDDENASTKAAQEENKARLHKVVLKKVSLRRGVSGAGAAAESPGVAASGASNTGSPGSGPEPTSGESAPVSPRPESEESVSVSIDPHLLDSIGESPRGVMAMIRSKSSAPDEIGRRRRSSNQGASSQGGASSSANGSTTTWVPGPDVKIIRLNIGGTRFATTLATLCKFPDSMLAVMFSGRFGPPPLDEEGHYFIDRDGSYFRFILNFLRDGTVVLPDDARQLKEILKEAIYFQLPMLVKDILRSGRRKGVSEFLTVRYLPGATYDGWPIRIEGTLLPNWIKELNGDGTMPPEKESDPGVRNMFGRAPVYKMRGVFLTSIFNVLSQAGWKLISSNGSGAGVEPRVLFCEMYIWTKQSHNASELHTVS